MWRCLLLIFTVEIASVFDDISHLHEYHEPLCQRKENALRMSINSSSNGKTVRGYQDIGLENETVHLH